MERAFTLELASGMRCSAKQLTPRNCGIYCAGQHVHGARALFTRGHVVRHRSSGASETSGSEQLARESSRTPKDPPNVALGRARRHTQGTVPCGPGWSTGEAIASTTDFWATFLTSFFGLNAPWIFITATTSSRAKAFLTTLWTE